jgi:zinc protease
MLKSCVTLFFCLFINFSWALNAPTQTFQLENGLKVVIREDHRAPIVAAQIWYRVGSKDEYLGVTGLSHALEHMMFQGTPSLPGNQIMTRIAEMGGQINAFTSYDFTAYHEVIAKEHLETILGYEADRMRQLTIDPDLFAKELQVIIEERRMRVEDNPTGLADERFMAQALLASPYAQPVIGWMSDLENMTSTDLRDWYEQWYAPNFATLVLVGDIEFLEAQDMVKRLFGQLAASRKVTEKPIPQLPAIAETRLKITVPNLQLPRITVGYRVPSATSSGQAAEEAYALALLATILQQGQSSLLVKKLVREDAVAVSVGADYSLYSQHPFLFTLAAVPNQTTSLDILETKLLTEIELIQQQGVSESALQTAKNQLTAHTVFSKDSMSQQAQMIGVLESVGLGWQAEEDLVNKIKGITSLHIQQAAARYLTADNRIIAHYVPAVMDSVSEPKKNSSSAEAGLL